MGRLPIVFELLLVRNKISEVAINAFDGLLQLLNLDLSENNITELAVGSLSGLVSLREINLSHNGLERTENDTNCIFEDNLSLKKIDLSYNRFSNIKQLSFPQKRWTNYKVEDINLAHNNLAVVTKELLKGTTLLTKLNLSHNNLREINPGILGNLTNLETLDLSNNELTFLESKMLGPPPKLKTLDLSKNHLRKFPTEVFPKAPLDFINLEYNQIRVYDQNFLPKIRNGSRILVNNNPVKCDCRLINVKRYVESLRPKVSNRSVEYFNDFKEFKCRDGQNFLEASEADLSCDYLQDPLAPQINHNYDLEIKSFVQIGDTVEIRWRVRSKMDILGFKIIGLDDSEETISSLLIPYSKRSAIVVLKVGARSVCLLPTYSNPEEKVTKQCQKVNDFEKSNALHAVPNILLLKLLIVLLLRVL